MSAPLIEIHDQLLARFGPQHWWPGDSPFEITIGAILTQNTSWTNVEKAIANLKSAGFLSFSGLSSISLEVLAELIRPAGYFNVKALRLQNFLQMVIRQYAGDFDRMLLDRTDILREKLLAVKGIGPETADSILLYAANRPVFVIDAYTHRILFRHGIIEEDADYSTIQTLFADALPADADLFNEFHALFVRTGKEFCRKTKPRCNLCPLCGV
ncbi:MAG: endonuclease III domain-containing protein [Deltaproteobacteria bacterium]